MTILEAAVLLILMLMALPDFCRRIHRPGLLYPLYIVVGLIAGAFMGEPVRHVWREVGQFGFILLLFSVGLEIELPEKRESLVALRRAGLWMVWQLPFLVGLAWLGGVPWSEGLVAGVALAGTSVGMAFHLWEKYPFPDQSSRKQFLEWIVAAEVLAILLLSFSGLVLQGVVWWYAALKICGLVVAAAVLASRGAAKTAFVLGMFISRSTHEEVGLNSRLEPIRDRMFVPVFFFSLGTLVEPRMFLTSVFALAIVAALLLFGARKLAYKFVFAKLFRTEPGAHIIAAPMLTMAAVAVEVLSRTGASSGAITWTLAAGLTFTLTAGFFRVDGGQRVSGVEPAMAAPQAWAHSGRGRNA